MPSDMKRFQEDRLESVRQMKRDDATCNTKVTLTQAAEARQRRGIS